MTFVLFYRLNCTYACILYVLRLILCCALRFLKYKRVHNSNWHSPYLLQQSTTISTLLFNIKVRYPSFFRFIYIFTHSPHSPHSSFRLRERWTLVSWGGSCTLPDLDLTSSMSERKKSQAGASVPPTPGGEKDHAHSLGTH